MERWRRWVFVAVALTAGIAEGSAGQIQDGRGKTVPPPMVISRIFHQLVAFHQPAEFDVHTASETTREKSYLREVVLQGETVERWTQMLTVTGYRGLAQVAGATPERMGDNIASGFQKACPDSFAGKAVGRLTISGRSAYLELVRCGSVADMSGGPGARRSETALIAVIAGDEDLYTVQWAERGSPLATAAGFDDAKWQERFKRLNPIRVCPVVEGEKAPIRAVSGTEPKS